MDKSTWLITGASSGLGYALAEHVLEQGDQVVLGARTLGPMVALTDRYPDTGSRSGSTSPTRSNGLMPSAIDDYAATSGAFREMLKTITPEMWPGDPARAAAAIYQVANSDEARHWLILGSDAHRRIGVKLDMQRAEYEAGREMALSTDYPDATGPTVL